MSNRRSRNRLTAHQRWADFVDANRAVIAMAGLPAPITTSIDHFDDFLAHGVLEHHPDQDRFQVDSLSPGQYDALISLVESYFVAGYEWFTPSALKAGDCEQLRQRFAR